MLFEVVKIAHEGRNQPLDVKHHGSYCTWDARTDKGWKKYSNARSFISRYKLIDKILTQLGYI